MPNSMETRPWFLDNLMATINSIYVSFYPQRKHNLDYWRGVMAVTVAFVLAIGGDVSKILSQDDMKMWRDENT